MGRIAVSKGLQIGLTSTRETTATLRNHHTIYTRYTHRAWEPLCPPDDPISTKSSSYSESGFTLITK